MTLMKFLVGAAVAIVVAADVSPIKVHKNIAVTEELKKALMKRDGNGAMEYEFFCQDPGEADLVDACWNTNPFDIFDCESLQLFSGYYLGCIESQCGPECEVVPNQYQLYLEYIEAVLADQGLICDLGTACTIIDLATGGTSAPTLPNSPTSQPTAASGGPLCTDEQGELADACIEEISGFSVADCEQLDYVIAAFVKCTGLHCGQSCETVGAFLAPQVAAIAESLGCETTGDACQLTVSPTKSPSSSTVITPFPTVVDIPLTQFPTPAPVAAPTPLVTSSPVVSPPSGTPSTGTDSELVAVVIIGGLSVVVVILAIALIVVLCMKKKPTAVETEVKASTL